MTGAILAGILFCPLLAVAPGLLPPSQTEAQGSMLDSNAMAAKAPVSAGGAALAAGLTEYRIGPEDVLKIEVFKEADFSASALVRTDGKISLPLLNDVQAAGLTPMELAATLQQQLSEFVKEPKVTVVVAEMNSRKAYVMGMVNRQGAVRLLANFTVLQAISAAGGLAPFAKSKQIYVLRTEGQEQRRLPFNYDAVIKSKHREQNIVLQPGDTVVVP
jgi:polysaccharide export outer membrane protein